jgi:hypothetical protein
MPNTGPKSKLSRIASIRSDSSSYRLHDTFAIGVGNIKFNPSRIVLASTIELPAVAGRYDFNFQVV